MKKNFKQVLNEYKGKTLDAKLIAEIASKCEAEISSWMYENGMYLQNGNTSMVISPYAQDKTFSITSHYDSNIVKEFSTLTNALKASQKSF